MYNVPLPVSVLRTRIREEFERHRFASKLPVVDVLLFKSHAEYQVCRPERRSPDARAHRSIPREGWMDGERRGFVSYGRPIGSMTVMIGKI